MIAVLDIETKNFTKRFNDAKSDTNRVALAPRPTLACIFWVKTRKYEYFTGGRLMDVVSSLHQATHIVTYNGDRFDFPVLERWCGLQRTPLFMAKSVDLCSVAEAQRFRFLKQPTRKGVNLNRCGKLNFGIPRKVNGTLKEKCRAHVRLTYQLCASLVGRLARLATALPDFLAPFIYSNKSTSRVNSTQQATPK